MKDDSTGTLIKLQHFRTVVVWEPTHILVATQNGYDYVAVAPGGLQVFRLTRPDDTPDTKL